MRDITSHKPGADPILDTREGVMAILQQHGLRQTRQRQVFLDVFLDMEGHPTPEEIHEEILRRGHSLGLATTYRILKTLVQVGVARRLEFGDGQSRYERRDSQGGHIHMVCSRCGRTFDAPAAIVNRLFEFLANAHGFILHGHSTSLHGVCDECRSASTKETPTPREDTPMDDHNHSRRRGCRGGRNGNGPTSFWLQDSQAVFDHLGLQEGMDFLDAGCGAGDYSRCAARLLGEGGSVTALDTFRQSVDHLNSLAGEDGAAPITARVCDITGPLPLDDGSADVIFLGTVLHIPQVRDRSGSMFDEFRRTLRPGGVLAVLECKKEEANFGPPLHMRLSEEDVEALASPHGFEKCSELTLEHSYLVCFRTR